MDMKVVIVRENQREAVALKANMVTVILFQLIK